MSELRIEKRRIPTANFHEVSSLPAVTEELRLSFMQNKFALDEDDELFVNYGTVDYAFPYKVQDNYDRELVDTEHNTVVLENKYLKATFMPHYGGKLWSLFDKVAGKELLFENSVVRPCHLGIRNAWLSGGIEWNCGYIGHNPFTCDWLHTARTSLDDGTPVLRFYQYERVRSIVYQMDFFLPEDSKLLFVRTKIMNQKFEVVPMYWWSNVAVEDPDGARVVVPADETYTAPNSYPEKIKIPVHNGIDVTYPADNVIAIDYFWKTQPDKRKYICQVNKDGYGLIQTSTGRLKGRKLFVWGNSEGGDRWKNFLTADDESGSYNEIQCGLTYAQFECIPMPPNTTWQWLEGYGAVQTEAEKVHGPWGGAKEEVESKLRQLVTEERMDEILKETDKMARTPAQEILFRADGWGALEVYRRKVQQEAPLCPWLDFGELGEEQQIWVDLLNNGTLGVHDPHDNPISYMLQPEWTALLQKAVGNKDKDNWFALLQLGLVYLSEKNNFFAEKYLLESMKKKKSAWAAYGLAEVYKRLGMSAETVKYMRLAYINAPENASLAKAYLRCLHENKRYDLLKLTFPNMADTIQQLPRCRVYYAFALAETDELEEAEKILYENGGIVVPDIRECETITSDLWYLIEEKKANRKGEAFDKTLAMPPQVLDFRMFTNLDWFNRGRK